MERDDRFVGRMRRRLEEQRRRVSGQRTRMRQTGLEDAETGGIGELSLYTSIRPTWAANWPPGRRTSV